VPGERRPAEEKGGAAHGRDQAEAGQGAQGQGVEAEREQDGAGGPQPQGRRGAPGRGEAGEDRQRMPHLVARTGGHELGAAHVAGALQAMRAEGTGRHGGEAQPGRDHVPSPLAHPPTPLHRLAACG
jgi:hypothetical protein